MKMEAEMLKLKTEYEVSAHERLEAQFKALKDGKTSVTSTASNPLQSPITLSTSHHPHLLSTPVVQTVPVSINHNHHPELYTMKLEIEKLKLEVEKAKLHAEKQAIVTGQNSLTTTTSSSLQTPVQPQLQPQSLPVERTKRLKN